MTTTTVEFGNTKVALDRNVIVKVLEALPAGTSKVCWKIDYEESGMGAYRAVLKFLKPLPPGGRPWKKLAKEVDRLRALRNSGVEGIDDVIISGRCTVKIADERSYSTDFVVCRYIPFTEPLGLYLKDQSPSYGLPFLLTLMARLLPILKACHRADCVHLDIHPNNILVKGNIDPSTKEVICEQVVLIDFATTMEVFDSRRSAGYKATLDAKTPPATVVDGYRAFLHPFLRQYLDDGQPVPKEALRSTNAKRFDLFAAARCLEEVLKRASVPQDEGITTKSISFVLESLRNEGDAIEYDIDKALGAVELNRAYLKKPILVRLAGEVNAVIPEKFTPLIDNYEIQRLRQVYQLGFSHLVYPSATHSRFSHSIGVFHLCNQYISALQANSEIFRGMYTETDLDILRVAAIVHDIGHYPFAHYFEELWGREKEYGGSRLKVHHESMGLELLMNALNPAQKAEQADNPPKHKSGLGSGLERILGPDALSLLRSFFDKNNGRFQILRSILNGPIDCDKVDYLMRDGRACGVPYAAAIDIQRLLASLTVCYDSQSQNGYILAVTSKGVAPVESILNARYHMFSEVYWHKACRGIAAMIKHALYRLNKVGISQQNFNVAMFSGSDWHVLKWLADELRAAGYHDVADDLIQHPLLDCNRRALYHRIITFSAIWDFKRHSDAWKALWAIGNSKNYRSLNSMKERIRVAMNSDSKLKNAFRSNGVSKILEHQLLIDIPPAEEKAHQFPSVFYPETKNQAHVLPLNEVSGIHTTDSKFDGKSPLELTQKIRVFTTRTHARLIRGRWSTTQELGDWMTRIITGAT